MALGPNGIVVDDKKWNNYLYMYYSSSIGQQQIKSISSGSIQVKFNKTSFREMPIMIPDESVLSIFDSQYAIINKLKIKIWLENRELINLRDSLLPMLMNGQVTIE